jgi:hypothetical protein
MTGEIEKRKRQEGRDRYECVEKGRYENLTEYRHHCAMKDTLGDMMYALCVLKVHTYRWMRGEERRVKVEDERMRIRVRECENARVRE